MERGRETCVKYGNVMWYNRRKFRSQTSDNMVRWKSRGGKSQRGDEKKREDQRGERVKRKKMQVHKKVGKSRFTVFFKWFLAPEVRKVGSLKRRVRSQLAWWEMKNCTGCNPTSTFPSQKCRKLTGSDHFWKLRCQKSARHCGAKHISESKVSKTDGFGPLFEVQMSKKWALPN